MGGLPAHAGIVVNKSNNVIKESIMKTNRCLRIGLVLIVMSIVLSLSACEESAPQQTQKAEEPQPVEAPAQAPVEVAKPVATVKPEPVKIAPAEPIIAPEITQPVTDLAQGVAEAVEGTAKAVAEVVEEVAKAVVPSDVKMVPIPLELPKPMFVGTPQNLRVPNLEKPLGKPRPPFYAPEGTTNVAAGKTISSSDEEPVIGEIEMITDGDKDASDGSFVELGPFEQYVTVDLGAEHEIYAVIVWHFHKQPRVYFDVVVQLSNDPDFITGVTTIFNNDIDNSLGLGLGSDMHYVETSEGKLIDAKGSKARYVKLHSNGNNANELNHFIEVEIYGKPID